MENRIELLLAAIAFVASMVWALMGSQRTRRRQRRLEEEAAAEAGIPKCPHGWKLQYAEKHCRDCRAKLAEEFAAAERERAVPKRPVDLGYGAIEIDWSTAKLSIEAAREELLRLRGLLRPDTAEKPAKPIEAGDDVVVNGVVVGKVTAAYPSLETVNVKLSAAGVATMKADHRILRRPHLVVVDPDSRSLDAEIEAVVNGWTVRLFRHAQLVGYFMVHDGPADIYELAATLVDGAQFTAAFHRPAARRVMALSVSSTRKTREYLLDMEVVRR